MALSRSAVSELLEAFSAAATGIPAGEWSAAPRQQGAALPGDGFRRRRSGSEFGRPAGHTRPECQMEA